ncbi:ATP-dependent DNA helicase UvrD2 [Streptomyces sp. NP160]|uniref:ATP-dependent DNA helicase UvrD2 n=1 Tax=Streptomyces sp. NP160 TaxID=2586637 RepID=UPI001118BF22|nr:ATP-dependent DNA helicase UvrD2 [Streptomyces sp. NP160]TNM68538.1 ATP-dependent DNA helicase UvrD2 [Streptomyces sp. NP160]
MSTSITAATHATLADAVLASLDPEQRAVASALRGPVCVLAGAGTGKTRAITHRIAHGVHAGVYDPRSVLALTFTSRAAGEMRSRLRDLGVPAVQARTFHAAALRQLQYFWPTAVGGPLPVLVEHKARLVAEAASRLRLSVDRTAVRDLSAEVEWAKVALLTPEAYPAAVARSGRTPPAGLDPGAMSRVMQSYEDVKTDRGAMDFEDVLLLTCGILAERGDVAESVRRQYRHFTVDEYQDVSPLQQRLLDLWLGGREDVCVVGDASQTIYSFAGATPAHLLEFPKRHPGASVIRLVRDYRSTPQVVALANRLLDRAPAAAVRARVELVAQRPAGPDPTFTEYDDDVAEAAGVAAAVRRRIDAGTPPAEIAVLFRTNGQSEPLEAALTDAGVGYQLRGGEKFFFRAEVRQAVLLLRGAARSDDGSRPLGEAVRDVLASAGWTAEPPTAAGAARERWASLQALAALADDVAAARPGARVADLVTEVDERSAAQHAPTVQGVTLASFHAAKGLEWDAVWLVGVSEGLLPISFSADDPDKVEEERRLLYVGITRAREHLAVSWGRARTPGGRASRTPSRFLDGLRPVDPAERERRRGGGGGAGGGGGRSKKGPGLARVCRSCGLALNTPAERKVGRCESCPPTYDEGVFDALRTWRSATASEAKVPAYVVFTDATLVAIAETTPSDTAGLARIPGVGPAKLERYGEAVLGVLGDAVSSG